MSNKIPVKTLIHEFEVMRDEHWAYILGSAKKGVVDCSGAFTYVWKKYGLSIDHGSNSIIRKFIVGDTLPISEAVPGMAVFKVKNWTGSAVDQSNKWYGTAPGNSYHIGLVVQNGSKMSVIHAKGQNYGVVETDLDKTWSCVANLKNVDYEVKADEIMGNDRTNASVMVRSGRLNIRKMPDVKSEIIGRLNNNDRIEVLEKSVNDFYRIQVYDGTLHGYVKTEFVAVDGGVDISNSGSSNFSEMMFIVEDEDGNKFYPNGSFHVYMEPKSID